MACPSPEVTHSPDALLTSLAIFIPGCGKIKWNASASGSGIQPYSWTIVPGAVLPPLIDRQQASLPDCAPAQSVRAERTRPSTTVHSWFGSALLHADAMVSPLLILVAPREVRHLPPSN